MLVHSSDFRNQGFIPTKFTCEGSNTSPAVSWRDVPRKAKSLVLILDDPDAPVGTWTHWIVYNIPVDVKGLPAGIPALENLPHGAQQGKNSFQKVGYGGPCPPPGHGPHRYFFRLYALDKILHVRSGASRQEIDDAVKGHILTWVEMMGRFERQTIKKSSSSSMY